jgi:hypothetical protein
MQAILVVVSATGRIVGSLASAALFCWLLWNAGRAWRRQPVRNDEDTQMQGSRLATARSAVQAASAVQSTAEPTRWTYPVILACLSEGRAPTRDERHRLASRLWREGFERRFASTPRTASFAERRTLSRATKATLRGNE